MQGCATANKTISCQHEAVVINSSISECVLELQARCALTSLGSKPTQLFRSSRTWADMALRPRNFARCTTPRRTKNFPQTGRPRCKMGEM